jgi:hypothetical protein
VLKKVVKCFKARFLDVLNDVNLFQLFLVLGLCVFTQGNFINLTSEGEALLLSLINEHFICHFGVGGSIIWMPKELWVDLEGVKLV